ncbi:nuclear transport factor 2 family protein [Actinotalea sp. M2MS4P-6]|uniref:nuclear transport factor 2 family protein n=1 Tax=Actinotalea sp. M2MS4P-6 TaxID=2983762 RepID=UPI0021E511AD|nr:nuclear transport factor 2 family protein [Actinotalea sp. M2MS4P-6]MCV2395157.1 nuclear transport factor 2 family protein [Actinotalea sp. M2MS4P-6]
MATPAEVMETYYETYGTGDYATVPFSEDVVFESVLGKEEGRENVVNHLTVAHGGGAVKEKLIPQNMVFDGDRVAVEVVAELSFEVDIPDFPFGDAKAGETIAVRFGAFYEIKDDAIARVSVYRF